MYCKNCGAKNTEEARYCESCGYQVEHKPLEAEYADFFAQSDLEINQHDYNDDINENKSVNRYGKKLIPEKQGTHRVAKKPNKIMQILRILGTLAVLYYWFIN